MVVQTYPSCPSCGRTFQPGVTWQNANYCRALYLLPCVKDTPGIAGYELSEKAEMSYADVTRGMTNLREWDVLETKQENREAGGFRYRYYPRENHEELTEKFAQVVRDREMIAQKKLV